MPTWLYAILSPYHDISLNMKKTYTFIPYTCYHSKMKMAPLDTYFRLRIRNLEFVLNFYVEKKNNSSLNFTIPSCSFQFQFFSRCLPCKPVIDLQTFFILYVRWQQATKDSLTNTEVLGSLIDGVLYTSELCGNKCMNKAYVIKRNTEWTQRSQEGGYIEELYNRQVCRAFRHTTYFSVSRVQPE